MYNNLILIYNTDFGISDTQEEILCSGPYCSDRDEVYVDWFEDRNGEAKVYSEFDEAISDLGSASQKAIKRYMKKRRLFRGSGRRNSTISKILKSLQSNNLLQFTECVD